MGMTAGVIGITAGVAGAATATKTLTGHSATAVPSTGTTTLTNTITAALGANASAATGKGFALDISAATGTATFDTTAPTCATTRSADVTCAATITGTTHKVMTVTLTTTGAVATSVKSALTVTLTSAHVKTTGAHGAISASSPAGTGWGAASAVTIANAPTVGPTTGNAITATSAPKIASSQDAESAGTLTITLRGTSSTNTTTYLDLTAKAGNGGTVGWNSATVNATGVSIATTSGTSPTTYTNHTLAIHLDALPSGDSATVHVTGIKYNTHDAAGTVTVTPAWVNTSTPTLATATYGSFTPTSAVNAYATHTTLPTAATTYVHSLSTPYLKSTGSGQAAGDWTISFATATKGTGWYATEHVDITVKTHTGTNCTGTAHGYILFTGTPTATLTSHTNVSTAPTFTVTTTATGTTCTGVSHNEAVLTFTNTGTFTNSTASDNKATITLSGVKYDVTAGTVPVYGDVTVNGTTSNSTVTTGKSNADIAAGFVSADTPSVSMAPSSYDHSISPVKLVENTTDTVKAGYVCLSLSSSHFNAASSPTAKATSGNGTVTATAFYENSSGTKVTSGTATYAVFEVKTASASTKPSTYSVSGLAVNAASTPGTPTVTAKPATVGSDCEARGTSYGSAVAFSIASPSTQIYGSTADATAAQELDTTFKHTNSGGHPTSTCAGGTSGTTTSTHAVVLARDTYFSDALASQDLAKYLNTGTLLTPSGSLSTATITALRVQGIRTVYVVGGPDAISTKVVDQIKTTLAYDCGGSTLATVSGKTVYINVVRIYGQTEYGTAKQVAEFVGSAGTISAAGAYAGVNKTGGEGMYNATAGSASTHPNFANGQKTVILATGKTWSDAEAASALAYSTKTPILLTTAKKLSTTAETAIKYVGATQVIVMGGQDAISNTVTKTLMTTVGVSVLRIAGATYTQTAVELAEFELTPTTVGDGLGWKTTGSQKLLVARGDFYTDGLAGAVLEKTDTESPLVLTVNPSTVGTYLTTFLKIASHTYGITALVVLGGPDAVNPATIAQMETDLNH